MVRQFAIYLAAGLLFAILAQSKGSQIRPKIADGEPALDGEFPYHVALRLTGMLWDYAYCGGALVEAEGKQFVVTSATCVYHFTFSEEVCGCNIEKDIDLVAGDINSRDESGLEQVRKSNRAIAHPDYGYYTKDNDIAVLGLVEGFTITDDVQPIRLPTQGQRTTGDVILTGFGGPRENESGRNYTYLLEKLQLPLISTEECAEIYEGTLLNITGNAQLCTQSRLDGPNHCYGDRGSPVKSVDGEYLAGIIAYPDSCSSALPCVPDVYTDVAQFVDWIILTARDL